MKDLKKAYRKNMDEFNEYSKKKFVDDLKTLREMIKTDEGQKKIIMTISSVITVYVVYSMYTSMS